MRRLSLPLAFLIVSIAPSADQPAPLSGKWKIVVRTLVETYSLTSDIRQNGDQISGTVCGNRRCYPISGVASGRNVEIRVQIQPWRNAVTATVSLTGVVDGNSVAGAGECAGTPCDWKGERVTPDSQVELPEPPGPPEPPSRNQQPPISVTGQWRFRIETEYAVSYPVFEFTQEGDVLAGRCLASFGETRVGGTVRGNQVSFLVRVARREGETVLEYTGVGDRFTMSGSVRLGETGWGTWTAQRLNR